VAVRGSDQGGRVRPGVEDVWRLGNLLRSCKGTHGDCPRLIPNIHCRVPEFGRLQPSMNVGESLHGGEMGISQQLPDAERSCPQRALSGPVARRLASIGAESLRCEPLATATRVFGGAFGRGALWARDSVAIANLTSE